MTRPAWEVSTYRAIYQNGLLAKLEDTSGAGRPDLWIFDYDARKMARLFSKKNAISTVMALRTCGRIMKMVASFGAMSVPLEFETLSKKESSSSDDRIDENFFPGDERRKRSPLIGKTLASSLAISQSFSSFPLGVVSLDACVARLARSDVAIVKPEQTPISVQLLEPREGTSPNKSIGPGSGPGGPRSTPKLGTPTPPAQRTGRLDKGSIETSVPSILRLKPRRLRRQRLCPLQRFLASDARTESINVKETSPDSLVRLPTKESPTNLPGNTAHPRPQQSLAALKGGEGPGIKALKEGTQIPGALKGTGTGSGPYGVPGGSTTGTGVTGGVR